MRVFVGTRSNVYITSCLCKASHFLHTFTQQDVKAKSRKKKRFPGTPDKSCVKRLCKRAGVKRVSGDLIAAVSRVIDDEVHKGYKELMNVHSLAKAKGSKRSRVTPKWVSFMRNNRVVCA